MGKDPSWISHLLPRKLCVSSSPHLCWWQHDSPQLSSKKPRKPLTQFSLPFPCNESPRPVNHPLLPLCLLGTCTRSHRASQRQPLHRSESSWLQSTGLMTSLPPLGARHPPLTQPTWGHHQAGGAPPWEHVPRPRRHIPSAEPVNSNASLHTKPEGFQGPTQHGPLPPS